MVDLGSARTPLVNQLLVVVAVLNTILSCGLGLGYVAAVLDYQAQDQENDEINGSRHIETLGEMAFVSAIIIIPVIMERKGRRLISVITSMHLLLGWLTSLCADHVVILSTVNVLHHIGLGAAISTSSVIISEFCTPTVRGTVLMLETAMISLGVLLSHVFAISSCWRLIPTIGIFTSGVSLTLSLFWLESPYWLVSQGHILKCTENFHWIRGFDEDTLKELDALLLSYKVKFQLQALKPIRRVAFREKASEYLKGLLNADFLKPLSIMILLFSFVGFGGENVAASFSFRETLRTTHGKYISTIIMDVLTLICSLIACVLTQIVKRKPLFIFTGSCSVLFLAVTSLVVLLQSLEMLSPDCVWLLLCFSTGFAMFMSLGTTALPLTMLGEIFPMSYNGVGCSLTCAYLWAFGNTVLKSVPYLIKCIGLPALLLISVIFMAFSLLFLNRIMPDTTYNTLLEIENLLRHAKHGNDEYDIVNVNDSDGIVNFSKINVFFEV